MTLTDLRFDDEGLVPVVAQEADSGEVLLVAYMNRQALEMTLSSGKLHLWSRSRRRLWLKGEQSGHFQAVREIRVNCEANSLLVRVHSEGPACHDGYSSCFYRQLDALGNARVVDERLFDPEQVYSRPTGGEG